MNWGDRRMMPAYRWNPLLPSRLWIGLIQYLTPVVAAIYITWRASGSLPTEARGGAVLMALGPAWVVGILLMTSTYHSAREALDMARAMWTGVVERVRAPAPKSCIWLVIQLICLIATPMIGPLATRGHVVSALVVTGVVCTLAPVWVLGQRSAALSWRILYALMAMSLMATLVQIEVQVSVVDTTAAALSSALEIAVVDAVLPAVFLWWIGRAVLPSGAAASV